MATHTPNLDLIVWDSPSDTFNSATLASNFTKIDADYARTRPTNSAEVLTALPGVGNFEGRLVYLSAAAGGFGAGTLVKFTAGSFKPVAGVEVLAAVPSSGNFAGRMVLLSATSGTFAAWSLIRYDGAAWGMANYTYELLGAVPITGNFAGRMVMLTSASGGFAAYDLIRYNGTSWAKIGPSPIPPGTEVVVYHQTTDLATSTLSDPGDVIINFPTSSFENVKYYFEITVPLIYHTDVFAPIWFRLRESTTNVVNRVGPETGGTPLRSSSFYAKSPFTPTAGLHTYTVTWFMAASGTATISATGNGPATFAIIKA